MASRTREAMARLVDGERLANAVSLTDVQIGRVKKQVVRESAAFDKIVEIVKGVKDSRNRTINSFMEEDVKLEDAESAFDKVAKGIKRSWVIPTIDGLESYWRSARMKEYKRGKSRA